MDSTPVYAKLIRTPLDLTPVGEKTSYARTPATESSELREKARKEYVPEDPNSDTNLSETFSSDSDSSEYSNYKCIKRDKKKNYSKCNKWEPIKLCAKLTEKLLTTAYK